MEPTSKKNSPQNHDTESLIASLVTISAFILAVEEREWIQTHNWLEIMGGVLGTMFVVFLTGGIGVSAVHAFYTFNPNAKKGKEEREQPKSIVERVVFWIVFLAVVGWLTLKFSGAI